MSESLSSRRVLIIVVAVGGSLLLATGLFFGQRIYLVYSVERALVKTAGDKAALSLLPQRREIRRESARSGPTVGCFGYGFEFPWPDLEGARGVKSFIGFRSHSHGSIMLFKRATFGATFDPLRVEADGRKVLGQQSTASEFALEEAVLNATPMQLSVLSPTRDTVRIAILLTMKKGLVSSHTMAIYSFEMNDWRGFQIGEPSSEETVQVEIFDAQTNSIQITFTRRPGSEPILQSHIDKVLSTLHAAEPLGAADCVQRTEAATVGATSHATRSSADPL